MPCLIAELPLALWLLVKGVNAQEWTRRTGSAKVDGSAAAL